MTRAAQDALGAFLGFKSIRAMATYEGARGRCFQASYLGALWMRSRGIPARIVRFIHPRIVSPYSREDLRAADDWTAIHDVELASGIVVSLTASELYHARNLEQHGLEVEGETLIDPTWRSWEPESAFPRISSVAEYAIDFDVDHSVCGHCGYCEARDGGGHVHTPLHDSQLLIGLRFGVPLPAVPSAA